MLNKTEKIAMLYLNCIHTCMGNAYAVIKLFYIMRLYRILFFNLFDRPENAEMLDRPENFMAIR